MALTTPATPNRTAEVSAIIGTALDRSKLGEDLPARAVRAYVVRRARVECLEGEIWVTGPGIDDEVLGRGESIAITGPGKIVVQALVTARLQVWESAD